MKYLRVTESHPQSMRLQGIGFVKGTPAGEIKVGNSLLWNFGYKSEVIEIKKETAKSLVIVEKSSTGKNYERRFLKSRLVCILINE